jgi:hypothetical protein
MANIEDQMLEALPSGTLRAGDDQWRMYVLDAKRVERDWFMRLAIVGQRVQTVDIRVRAETTHSATAQRVLLAVRDWLLSDDEREEVFLEVPGIDEPAN